MIVYVTALANGLQENCTVGTDENGNRRCLRGRNAGSDAAKGRN